VPPGVIGMTSLDTKIIPSGLDPGSAIVASDLIGDHAGDIESL
jgi:hypothetical protein